MVYHTLAGVCYFTRKQRNVGISFLSPLGVGFLHSYAIWQSVVPISPFPPTKENSIYNYAAVHLISVPNAKVGIGGLKPVQGIYYILNYSQLRFSVTSDCHASLKF